MSESIDDQLDDWFKRSFRRPRGRRGGRRTITHTKIVPKKRYDIPRKGVQIGRLNLLRTVSKTPEVMVKISGGGSGMPQVKAHFEYISRNGQVELENDSGEVLLGRRALRDLCDEWQFGQYGIPEVGRNRQAFNIVLSMPPGTYRDAVKSASRDFASRQFGGNHPYVFVEHADEAHPHVHLCVKAMGNDGTRLNPRKADLQQWREDFAWSLREQGIEANATPRLARGVVGKSARQKALHMEHRAQGTASFGGRLTTATEEPCTERMHPIILQPSTEKSRRKVFAAYGEAARLLAASSEIDDQRLALDVVAFVRSMLPQAASHDAVLAKGRGEPLQQSRPPKSVSPRLQESGVKLQEKER